MRGTATKVIDLMPSESWGCRFTRDSLPTITKSHAKGLWVTSLADCLRPVELLAAQGYQKREINSVLTGCSANVLAEMAGNSFTVPVVQKLLRLLLPAIGA